MSANRLTILVLSWLLTCGLYAQKVKVRSGFVEDSIEIGQVVGYWITAAYPAELEVIFPDSLYSFRPFEYLDKTYQPTEVRGKLLFDSALYRLQSFEIDPYQSLQLPVLILDGDDSLYVESPVDSIAFRELVREDADPNALLSNSQYVDVPMEVNYPLLWIILAVASIIVLLVFFFFGKKIRVALQIRRLKKDYIKYNERLTEAIRSLKAAPDIAVAEHAITDWKHFMERMEGLPYSKLTTSEILTRDDHHELSEALRTIDRMIYGGQNSETIYRDFQSIEDFTQHRYQLKINEMKHGSERK